MQEIEKRASEIIQKKIKQRKYRLKKKKKNSNNRHKCLHWKFQDFYTKASRTNKWV